MNVSISQVILIHNNKSQNYFCFGLQLISSSSKVSASFAAIDRAFLRQINEIPIVNPYIAAAIQQLSPT